MEKYGKDTFTTAMTHFMDYGEKVSLQALKTMPKGRFEVSEPQDDGSIYNVIIEIADGSTNQFSTWQGAPSSSPIRARTESVFDCGAIGFLIGAMLTTNA